MNSKLAEPVSTETQSTFDMGAVRAQQDVLRRHARLHWIHWLIVASSVLITFIAWQTSHSALLERNRTSFITESERVITMLSERLAHYEDALLSGVAAIQARGGSISRAEWRRYAQYLRLNERYPGVSGIGIIQYVDTEDIPQFLEKVRRERPDYEIHPPHIYDFSMPILFIEPEDSNSAAIGLDVAFEHNRRNAALLARSQGKTQISGPIVLVQDSGKTPGFLFYAPYYRYQEGGLAAPSQDRRDATFEGMVYAPLVVRDLVQGVLSQTSQRVKLRILDGSDEIFSQHDGESAQGDALSYSSDESIHGRQWTFELISSAAELGVEGSNQPAVVLFSGLTLDIMLLALFWLMSRSNRRTLILAETMTSSLSAQAQALSESNKDLESFAHVVSHDLKSPIRNIIDLTQFLEEDLSTYLASNDANAEIPGHLMGLRQQATRSQTLISGILEYSMLGNTDESVESVDIRTLVTTIAEELNLCGNQWDLKGSLTLLETREVLLRQVLGNLMSNAIKYNPQKSQAHVSVSVQRAEDHCVFSVEDNGPGIATRFHERIFKPFTTLEARQDIHSSGIGLSIVQRVVELRGGSIWLESVEGVGSRFMFTWPDESSEPVLGAVANHV